MKPLRNTRPKRRLPQTTVLVLAVLLSVPVVYLTWPLRAAILCERLPELLALALLAATLFVLSVRLLANPATPDRRVPGLAAVLAGLSLFLAVRFVSQYRKPCAAVQQQVAPPRR